MSITKNIKCTDEKTSHSIKQILNIKDSHITFSKDAISKERVHGRMANVFTGLLTGEAHRCECCGFDSIIRHAYHDSWIQLLPYQEVPTYLRGCGHNPGPKMNSGGMPVCFPTKNV